MKSFSKLIGLLLLGLLLLLVAAGFALTQFFLILTIIKMKYAISHANMPTLNSNSTVILAGAYFRGSV